MLNSKRMNNHFANLVAVFVLGGATVALTQEMPDSPVPPPA